VQGRIFDLKNQVRPVNVPPDVGEGPVEMPRVKSLIKPLYYTAINIGNFFIPKRVALEWCKLYYIRNDLMFIDKYFKIPIALRCYYSMTDDEQELFNKKSIWGEKQGGHKWHMNKINNYREKVDGENPSNFKRKFEFLEFIKEPVEQLPDGEILEIGCGIGDLADAITQDSRLGSFPYRGYDISGATIETAKLSYPNLVFFHGGWENAISDSKNSNGVIIITSGTLEYFTSTELKRFLTMAVKEIKSGYLFLNESINFDIKSNIMSKPRGGFAYSHNYPKYIKQCGLDLVALHSKPSPTTLTHGTNTVDLLVCAKWGN
jgi:2-polyprenyl-3-methyl-5-hydroxy-6-metoxy-1,4-benzoquinol methylase